jgi:hypothetical protein
MSATIRKANNGFIVWGATIGAAISSCFGLTLQVERVEVVPDWPITSDRLLGGRMLNNLESVTQG